MTFFVNIAWFQIGWWSLLLSASKGQEWIGFSIAILLLGLHFAFLSKNRWRDLFAMLACASLGMSGDFLLIQAGIFQLPNPEVFFPTWLVGMWLLFPLTLPYSFAKLFSQRKLHALLAFMAGSSYYAGALFGVLYTKEPIWLNLGLACVAWFIYFRGFEVVFKKIAKNPKVLLAS